MIASWAWLTGRWKDGFLRVPHRKLVIADADAAKLLDRLSEYSVPVLDKWIDVQSG